jgi:hypothetical protein
VHPLSIITDKAKVLTKDIPTNRKGKSDGGRLRIQPLLPGQTVVAGALMRDERLLGRIVMEWSKLENSLLALLWEFLNLSFEDGKILCNRMEVGTTIQMLRAMAQRHMIKDEFFFRISSIFLVKLMN